MLKAIGEFIKTHWKKILFGVIIGLGSLLLGLFIGKKDGAE